MTLVYLRRDGDLSGTEVIDIAQRLEATMRDDFLRVVQDAGRYFTMRELEVAVTGGAAMTDALAKKVARVIINTYAQKAKVTLSAAANAGAQSAGTGIKTATATEYAELAARKFAASNLKDVRDQTRKAVRNSIADGIRDGYSLTAIAEDVRTVIGLDARQQVAVTNYRKGLEVPKGQAKNLSRRYAAQLKTQRAMRIARTETMFALNAGRQAMWVAARANGDLARDQKKVWFTAEDERTCPICAPMHGVETTFDRQFRVVYPKAAGKTTSTWLNHPPAHPNCRCIVMLQH